jgi:beta-glucosidase-like glycosyl hydrolase
LNGLLKEELGFQGYVMSDWGATHSGLSSTHAGNLNPHFPLSEPDHIRRA